MLKSPPLNGQFPLIQSFGDNPELYQTVACHGVKLRGHNGIDYATPIGTPVFAVQDGTVLEIGHEEDGFGHYVMLGHSWGQTLYAHLDRISVVQGQPVGGGSQVGLAGDSGSSARPHLHFGMRIHPFSVADGWCGFSDPQPYLARLTEPRGANIGPHLVGGVHRHRVEQPDVDRALLHRVDRFLGVADLDVLDPVENSGLLDGLEAALSAARVAHQAPTAGVVTRVLPRVRVRRTT